MSEEELRGEELTVFGLGPRETDEVAVYLVREGLWDWSSMVYDCDSTLLMTKTSQAKKVVMRVLEELNLLPKSETILHDVAV